MTLEPVDIKTCKKVNVLVDARIIIRLYTYENPWRDGVEKYARALEEAVREFEKFLRDHRSQDCQGLEVGRVYQDQCSACHDKWESYGDENGNTICANCGAVVTKAAAEAARSERHG